MAFTIEIEREETRGGGIVTNTVYAVVESTVGEFETYAEADAERTRLQAENDGLVEHRLNYEAYCERGDFALWTVEIVCNDDHAEARVCSIFEGDYDRDPANYVAPVYPEIFATRAEAEAALYRLLAAAVVEKIEADAKAAAAKAEHERRESRIKALARGETVADATPLEIAKGQLLAETWAAEEQDLGQGTLARLGIKLPLFDEDFDA